MSREIAFFFLRHSQISGKPRKPEQKAASSFAWGSAGSIPDGVIGFFHWHNPVGRTMALGSTQPLTEISTRNISWGVNTAGAYG
jgi:hypothetical protein